MEKQNGIVIAHLAEHVESIPVLATWGLSEWGHLSPGVTHEKLVERYKLRTTPGTIPETLVAVAADGQSVVGMASIVENDLSTRPDLTPWMAAVYVDAAVRDRGIGSLLVGAVMAEAAALAVDTLYLITHDRMAFYSRLGWTPIERVHYRGEDVTVMTYCP